MVRVNTMLLLLISVLLKIKTDDVRNVKVVLKTGVLRCMCDVI